MARDSALTVYWRLFKALPRTHRIFLNIVILQCIYVLIERLYVFITDYSRGDRSSVWYFVVILVSVAFIAYFGFHSVLQVNVRGTGGALASRCPLCPCVCMAVRWPSAFG